MPLQNSEPHLSDEIIDGYSIGNLVTDARESADLHLLSCNSCQSRLREADQFLVVFRAAAVEGLAERPSWRQVWGRVMGTPRLRGFAMAGIVIAIGTSLTVSGIRKHPAGHMAPSVIVMQAFRGAESGGSVPAGKDALLLFDVPASASAMDCRLEIVDLKGTTVSAPAIVPKNGRLEALVPSLVAGGYWVRLYRNKGGELVEEYSLKAVKSE